MAPKTLEQIAEENPGKAFPGTSVVDAKPLTQADKEAIAHVNQQRREAQKREEERKKERKKKK